MKHTMLNHKEMKTFLVILAGIVILFGGYFFRNTFDLSNATFLSFHLVLEMCSIMVSLIIAMQGWLSYQYTQSVQHLRLGALFLVVGFFDLAHTLSYDGMPLFLTESSVAKATWFWITARLLQSIGFLLIYMGNNKRLISLKQKTVYGIGVFLFLISFFVITYFADRLPPLMIEGEGATALKRGMEYFISLMQLTTFFLILWQYSKEKSSNLLHLLSAFALLFLSSFLFTRYLSIYDSLNFLAHIFKTTGYFFLLKGIYFSEREKQYKNQRLMQEQLNHERTNLQTISWNMGEGILVTDARQRVTFLNPEAERLLGWKKEELLHRPLDHAIRHNNKNESLTIFTAEDGEARKQEVLFTRKDGSRVSLLCSVAPLIIEYKNVGTVALFLDITKEKVQQDIIERQAFYDDLTNLPNQRLIKRQLEDLIAVKREFSLILINMDRFKRVNDSLGPDIGDLIIQATGQRLRKELEDDCYLARNRGDEFVIIIPSVTAEEEITERCQRIQAIFTDPIRASNYEVMVNISIGVSVYPVHGNEIEELIKKAYVALYSSKQQSNHFLIYHPYMDNRAYEGLMLENHLYKALMNEEFSLVYQPQIDVSIGKVIGLEALLRWNHPEKGVISPAEFIPIAEVSGLIVPIGEWVLRTSLRDLKSLHELGHMELTMSVNLSIRQFFDECLLDKIKAIIEEVGVKPQNLTLELTESVMMNTESTLAILQGLKKLGIKISIDDFGTGYSSLAYLKRLPIDSLKIDQSFIHDIIRDQSDMAIVSTILSMAKHLCLKVVAEGVETYDQLLHLKSLEENIMVQGYLISKPLSLEQLTLNWTSLTRTIQ